MKIFFRKHGNSLFYILLPVLFLALTVAFIQFTPRVSQTAPGDECTSDEQCCTTSGCGPQEISEICEEDTCKSVNVGCVDGTVNETAEGCVCVNDAGDVVGECVVCDPGEVFVDSEGGEPVCRQICGPNEDPATGNCVPLGAFVEGSGVGCALSVGATSVNALSSLLMGLGMLSAAFVARKRK